MSTLNPILKRSTEALALDQLRAAIVGGTLAPGARLTEQDLSDKLGTSRATIRSALHHLVSEGLVVQVPYTGWMVISLTAKDARELVSLRASLESLAAELAAISTDMHARNAFKRAYDALVTIAAAHKSAEASAADASFHRTMVLLSGHERLAQHYRLVEQQISVLIASSNALLPDPVLLVDQHQPIFDAIARNDAAAASDAVRAHINAEGAKLITNLAAGEVTSVVTGNAPKTAIRKPLRTT